MAWHGPFDPDLKMIGLNSERLMGAEKQAGLEQLADILRR
jgi:hypothetical protein